jgi:hypothetical protein
VPGNGAPPAPKDPPPLPAPVTVSSRPDARGGESVYLEKAANGLDQFHPIAKGQVMEMRQCIHYHLAHGKFTGMGRAIVAGGGGADIHSTR